jgi:hypothetical protein
LEERGTAATSGGDLPDGASRKFLAKALDKLVAPDGLFGDLPVGQINAVAKSGSQGWIASGYFIPAWM